MVFARVFHVNLSPRPWIKIIPARVFTQGGSTGFIGFIGIGNPQTEVKTAIILFQINKIYAFGGFTIALNNFMPFGGKAKANRVGIKDFITIKKIDFAVLF